MRSEKIVKGIFYLIASGLSFIFSTVMGGSYVAYQAYGGDAFTGIQHANASTNESINDGFMYLFLIIAVILLGKGIGSLCGSKRDREMRRPMQQPPYQQSPYQQQTYQQQTMQNQWPNQ